MKRTPPFRANQHHEPDGCNHQDHHPGLLRPRSAGAGLGLCGPAEGLVQADEHAAWGAPMTHILVPCKNCLDSGLLLLRDGRWSFCDCASGWAQEQRGVNYCGKLVGGEDAVAIYSRPSVLHYFSRLYLMCGSCFKGFRRYKGLPDYYTTIGPTGLRCGSLVALLKRGTADSGYRSITAPDYMPIEDPRRFGLSQHGGAMKTRKSQ